MNTIDIYLSKVKLIAKWSYIGILAPFAGIVLALIALSMLRGIKTETKAEELRLAKVRSIARWGIVVSLWPLWVVTLIMIVSLINFSQSY